MRAYLWIILFISFSTKAIDVSYYCEIHQDNIENLFDHSLLNVETTWKINAVQICKTKPAKEADKATYVVFSPIQPHTDGICTFKAKKAFWQGQKPSWPSDLKTDVMYGRAINEQCLEYSSALARYISLSLLPESFNKNQFFLGLMELFDLLNGNEEDINKAFSSLSLWQKWLCKDCSYFKSLLLQASKSKDVLIFADSITTIVKIENPNEEDILMMLYVNDIMFQVFISYESGIISINDISIIG